MRIQKLLIWLIGVITLCSSYGATTYAQEYITTESDICTIEHEEGANPYYDFEFLGSRKKLSFTPGEQTKFTLYIENTGTIPLFSDESGCRFRPIARLGTTRERDRQSALFDYTKGWQSPNRIRLDQARLDPGEKGSFTFIASIPEEKGIYREYFDLVLEGKKWMNKDFAINVDVGEYVGENREFLQYIQESRKVNREELYGEKSIEVVIARQRMYLKVGDIVIKEFPVSTGTWRTPTPYGHATIFHKQDVRVAAKWPHYIMPKWMSFRAGGYGIHALPSIAYDNGYYWTEALNHIGTRRSHGCIRLLPQDAEFAYEFADIGTPVWVR